MPEHVATGQWLVSRGTRWFFDSGAVSLDFAHTGTNWGPADWEQLHAPGDLGRWLGERYPRLDAEPSERELADVLALRTAIDSIARALDSGRTPHADDID